MKLEHIVVSENKKVCSENDWGISEETDSNYTSLGWAFNNIDNCQMSVVYLKPI